MSRLQENWRREILLDYQVVDGVEVPSDGGGEVSGGGEGAGAGSNVGAGGGAGFRLTTRFFATFLAFFFIAFLAFFLFFAKTKFTEIVLQLWKPNNACAILQASLSHAGLLG